MLNLKPKGSFPWENILKTQKKFLFHKGIYIKLQFSQPLPQGIKVKRRRLIMSTCFIVCSMSKKNACQIHESWESVFSLKNNMFEERENLFLLAFKKETLRPSAQNGLRFFGNNGYKVKEKIWNKFLKKVNSFPHNKNSKPLRETIWKTRLNYLLRFKVYLIS